MPSAMWVHPPPPPYPPPYPPPHPRCAAAAAAPRTRQVARARAVYFRGKPKSWRMAEPCLLIVIFVTLGMMLPLFFPCTPTQCVIIQGETKPLCPDGTSSQIKCAGVCLVRLPAPRCLILGAACACLRAV